MVNQNKKKSPKKRQKSQRLEHVIMMNATSKGPRWGEMRNKLQWEPHKNSHTHTHREKEIQFVVIIGFVLIAYGLATLFSYTQSK